VARQGYKITDVFGAAFFKKLRKSRLFCKKGGTQKTFINLEAVGKVVMVSRIGVISEYRSTENRA
jgi:hypothetical protein